MGWETISGVASGACTEGFWKELALDIEIFRVALLRAAGVFDLPPALGIPFLLFFPMARLT